MSNENSNYDKREKKTIKPMNKYPHIHAIRVDDTLDKFLKGLTKKKKAEVIRNALNNYFQKPIDDAEMTSRVVGRVAREVGNIKEFSLYTIELFYMFIRYWLMIQPDLDDMSKMELFTNSEVKLERFMKKFSEHMKGGNTILQKILLMNPQLLGDTKAISKTLRQLAEEMEEGEKAGIEK